MKRVEKKKNLWDYYYDKQLETLLFEYEFDFDRVAGIFNSITQSNDYSKQMCEERYTQLYVDKKKQRSEIMEDILMISENNTKKNKSIYELFKDLPVERTAKDHLKITQDDIDNAFTIDSMTGEVVKPTGIHRIKLV